VAPPDSSSQAALADGVAALVGAKVKAGEGERLGELEPAILEQILSAYLGREAAAREARGRLERRAGAALRPVGVTARLRAAPLGRWTTRSASGAPQWPGDPARWFLA
jgi:hypothetical protein